MRSIGGRLLVAADAESADADRRFRLERVPDRIRARAVP